MRGTFARHLARIAFGATLAVTAATVPAGSAAADPAPRIAERRGAHAARAAFAAAGKARLAVELAPGADADAVVAEARRNGATLRHRLPKLSYVTVEVPAAAADVVGAALRRRPGVVDVRRVGTRSIGYTPNDSDYAGQQTYLATVNAPAAWDISKGSSDVLIAVLDTGVDTAHPDLTGKIAGSYNGSNGGTDTTDEIGHGTFVAGVAAAATDNALGVAGAGFDSRILAVKIADDEGNLMTDDEAAGITWAADNGADVINLSLGGEIDSLEQAAVEYAQGEGVVVVAAAGNDGTNSVSYPAAYDDVIAVGSTTGTARSSFSNYGSWVDVGAPGESIRSTTPTAGSELFAANYATSQGTSFASPLVAGEIGLLLAAYPAASPGTLQSAVTNATTGSAASYGFAHGRVDFAAAFQYLPPTTVPTLVTPAADATISGDVTVTATSTAPKVKFAITGGPAPEVAVVAAGEATTTLETYGLAGPQAVSAFDCSTFVCATTPDTHSVTVDNGTPTITSPAGGTEVGTATFQATATTPDGQGSVRFLVDGAYVAFDATAPYEVSINTSSLNNGTRQLTAVRCNRAGAICDGGHPSPAVSFLVKSLHPAITSIAPNPFSPNGDGLVDKTTVTYTVDVTQAVVLRIKDSNGTVVRGPGSLGTRPPGVSTWVWDGYKSDHTRAADGTYTVEITSSKTVASETLTGAASRTVRVDKTPPNMADPSGNGTTFYPFVDGYKDTFNPAITISETARIVLTVYNPAGTTWWFVDAGVHPPGRYSVPWTGRTSSGTPLPAGTYKYTFTASDSARNVRTTGRYSVNLSAKKLEARTAQATVSPYNSVSATFIGDCSSVYSDVRGWGGSLRWMSNDPAASPCTTDEVSDLAVTEHSFGMKGALKYGNIRIGVTGQASSTSHAGNADLVYLAPDGDTLDYGRTTGAAYGTYWGPLASANLMRSGATVRWLAGTVEGNWWDARSFTVRYVYYVLV